MKGAGGGPGKISFTTGQFDKEHLMRSLLDEGTPFVLRPLRVQSLVENVKTDLEYILGRPVQLSEPSPTFLRSYRGVRGVAQLLI